MGSKVDTSKFNAMCREMAGLTGASFQNVVEYEAAKVMEVCVRLTPAAAVGKIRDRHEASLFSAQPETLYTPQSISGRTARAKAKRFKGGKLLYSLEHRYPDELWAAIVAERGKHLKQILRARGISKRTWLEIARGFGYEISAAGFVKKAVPSGKVSESTYLAGMQFRRLGSRSRFTLYIENAQPTINAIGGERILARAIARRAAYFRRNLKLRVFESVAKIARRYPGIKTNPATL